MTAADGQSLYGQSGETQAAYQAAYGSGASAAWDRDHNAAIGAGGGYSGGGGLASDGSEAWANAAEHQGWMDEQTLANQRLQIENAYKVGMANARNDAERNKIQKWYNERQVELALLQHSIAQGQLGLGYLTQAVQWANSPDNYFKLLDFQAGARERQDVPLYLQALLNNTQQAPFQLQKGQPVAHQTADLLQALGYSGGVKMGKGGLPTQQAPSVGALNVSPTGAFAPAAAGAAAQQPVSYGKGAGQSRDVDPRSAATQAILKASPPSLAAGYSAQDLGALNAIAQLYSAPQKIQPGQWESLAPTAKRLTLAGISRLGGDPSIFLDTLQKSRLNMGSASAA